MGGGVAALVPEGEEPSCQDLRGPRVPGATSS